MSAEPDPLERALDVAELVNQHPVGTLVAALGVGYVLGGGLFTRLTERLVKTVLRVGVQLVAVPILEREIVGVLGSLVDGEGRKTPDGEANRAKVRTSSA